MGFFDRIRSGFRSIGERLHILKAKVPDEVKPEIAKIERQVERLAQEVKPQERIERERFQPDERILEREPEPKPRRFNVHIQYRPVQSLRKYRDVYETVEAESAKEALRQVISTIDDDDYYLYAGAKEVSE